MNVHMEKFFVKKDTTYLSAARNSRPFSICIVDEASQCVEPEMLIPFRLGFTKLVMVGDPEQLPGIYANPSIFCSISVDFLLIDWKESIIIIIFFFFFFFLKVGGI